MRKNEAQLRHRGQEFIIYQDNYDNWRFTFGNLIDVNTMHKELQPALNEIYSTIDDRLPKPRVQKEHRGGWRSKRRGWKEKPGGNPYSRR